MAFRKGRFIGRISSFVAAGAFFAAAIIVGLIPYSEGGYSGLCPSALQSLVGGTTTGQSIVNFFSGGRCTTYVSTMTSIMTVLFVLAIIALISAILLRNRRNAAAGHPAQAGYPEAPASGAPAQPDHAPAGAAGGTSPYAGSGYPVPENGEPADMWRTPATSGGQGSGSFDTKLLLVGLGAVAGIVLVSFLVDWLAFLPGIIELALWTAVGLTTIWQLKRRAAGTDPGKLADAEAWNPAVVARGAVAAGRHRLEIHRAQRREAERAQAHTPDPQSHSQQFSDPAETDAR